MTPNLIPISKTKCGKFKSRITKHSPSLWTIPHALPCLPSCNNHMNPKPLNPWVAKKKKKRLKFELKPLFGSREIVEKKHKLIFFLTLYIYIYIYIYISCYKTSLFSLIQLFNFDELSFALLQTTNQRLSISFLTIIFLKIETRQKWKTQRERERETL